jgi:Protein of unknown function (DUF3995)
MATSPSKGVRVAAGIVCAVFAAFALIHLLWAVGITWGLNSVWAGQGNTNSGIALAAVSLAAAGAAAAAIIVTLGRVGLRKTPLSDRVLHIGAWLVFAWPAIGTLNPVSTWEQRAVALPLAIAALVVARAHPRPVRAARAEGLPPRLRAGLARGSRLVGGALRPGRRAALAAGAGCAAYGALKLYWALGGELLLREAPLSGDARRDLLERTPGMVALNSASAALAAIGIALAVATVRDRRLPRLLVVGLPALIGALMLARAALSAAGDVAVLTGDAGGETYTARWDLALWSPFFAAWGAAWALAALAARRRRLTAPAPPARSATSLAPSTSARDDHRGSPASTALDAPPAARTPRRSAQHPTHTSTSPRSPKPVP